MKKLAGMPGIAVTTEFAQKIVPGSSLWSPLLNATVDGCHFRRWNSTPGIGAFSNGNDTCCKQAWLLKNSFWSLIRVKSGDQKCLGIREDRLYGVLAQS